MSLLSFNPVLGFLPVATYDRDVPNDIDRRFNPVLGFLPVATELRYIKQKRTRFNPVLGFLPVATIVRLAGVSSGDIRGFNPVLGFLPVATGGRNTAIWLKKLSQSRKLAPDYVDRGCTATS